MRILAKSHGTVTTSRHRMRESTGRLWFGSCTVLFTCAGLTVDGMKHSVFSDAEVLALILKALSSNKPDVQRYAAFAISNLAATERTRRSLLETKVVGMLKGHARSSDNQMAMAVGVALSNLLKGTKSIYALPRLDMAAN
jgi:hypothetical protein